MRQSCILLCVVAVFITSGCDLQSKIGEKSSTPQSDPATAVQAQSNDPLATAKEHIKTCLDSWAFGDDSDTFDKAHPEITFITLSDILRKTILTRYELGAHRPKQSDVEGTIVEGFEFNANLWFATNGGTENLQPYSIGVHEIPGHAGRWTVFAREKK